MSRILLFLVFTAFLGFSGYVVYEHGYLGIFTAHLHNTATLQVLCDLVISVLLLCGWIIRDARQTGRKAWPYVVASLVAGSLGPMAYLLFSKPASQG